MSTSYDPPPTSGSPWQGGPGTPYAGHLPPPPVPPGVNPRNTKPRRRWPLALGAGLLGLFAGVGIGSAGGDGGDGKVSLPVAASEQVTAKAPAPKPAASEAAATTRAPAPPPPPAADRAPQPKDFKLTVKTLTKQCFGEAGCNITYRVTVDYVGPGSPPSEPFELTYKVKGGESEIIGTVEVDDDGNYDQPEDLASTPRESSKLTAVVTEVLT